MRDEPKLSKLLPLPGVPGAVERYGELTSSLTDRQALALFLRRYRGLSAASVAEQLKTSKSTAKRLLAEAAREVRRAYATRNES